MRHKNSTDLLAYWERLRAGGPVPDRRDVNPKDIARLLPNIFILDISGPAAAFRLAGTAVCASHGRELKGSQFAAVWESIDRRQIETVAEAVGREKLGVIIGSRAVTSKGETVSFETLMLPLMDRGDSEARLIGIQSTLGETWSVGNAPIEPHSIVSMRMMTEGHTPARSLRAAGLTDGGETSVIDFSRRGRVPAGMPSRRVRHLTVIEGGAARAD